MSTRERIVQLIDQVPDYCLNNLQSYLQGMIAADEAADDAYCEQLHQAYENDPDRGQFMSEDELCKELGIVL